ncbi:MAG: HAD family phosphatase [Candidatus Marsarchaeota archaeon]|nr:HAD family phosphatase [Candidatus Marsarchaeota archaeon]MCL5418605.1 HAD family phosphatase [Candidatus Marsarchaeota archaeon]
MVDGIVFDLDGTLVDTVDLWVEVWGKTLEKYGIRIPKERVRPLIGLPPSAIIESALGRKCDSETEREIIDYRSRLIWKYSYMAKPFEDVKPELQWIKSMNIRVAVASSSIDKWIDEMLNVAGIRDLVDAYVSGTHVKSPKPAPDIFIEAFNTIGISPKDGMVVGDRESDTVPAMQIGAISVLVDRLGEFSKPKADFVIHSMPELHGLLANMR